uniref:Cytochrome c oxidase subunit 3 n=1 Tax=Proterops sp. QL-2014 TaxID=1491724 RepID=A0A0U1WH55_9HYME|nr:cytochrome c oxidase subunit III [Proterops sp. QL-2014]
MNKFNHPFHLVTISPWPLICSMNLMFMFTSILMFFNENNNKMILFNFLLISITMMQWWRDIIRESTLQGMHNIKVINGLYNGMILFIISEVMFFISFFWMYFHMFLSPSMEIGMLWSPKLIVMFNPYNIPLLNTLILLSSGITITLSHNFLMNNNKYLSMKMLYYTTLLAVIFSLLQYLEYKESFFSISDSIYGASFFMMTGFHGIHVIIGTIFIRIMYFRLNYNHFSYYHHIGFEMAAWYWHFVDIVWLFLYIFIYWMSY